MTDARDGDRRSEWGIVFFVLLGLAGLAYTTIRWLTLDPAPTHPWLIAIGPLVGIVAGVVAGRAMARASAGSGATQTAVRPWFLPLGILVVTVALVAGESVSLFVMSGVFGALAAVTIAGWARSR
jgi:hypothetical protein